MSAGETGSPSVDELLARLEKTIAELADGSAPLEELVVAHQRALRLLREAEALLGTLGTRAGELARSLSE
jgi:exodeoxyribonuclease VII small subunit